MVNAIHNVNEDNGDKDFVKVRVSENFTSDFHFLYAMVDSGNRACSLMSEKAFKKIYTNHTLMPVPDFAKHLTGAGDGHALAAIGMPVGKLRMWFYNPDPKEKRSLRVDFHPVIVRDLHLPFLLSYKDLKAINASLHFGRDILELPYPNDPRPLQIPTRSNLIQSTPVVTPSCIKIEPGEEAVFPVVIPNMNMDAEVLIEPQESFVTKTNLKMVTIVDKVRKRNQVTARVWNSTTHTVTIKPRTVIGQAIPFNEEPLPDVMACLANNSPSTVRNQIEDSEELFKRLWTDLFEKTETTLTDEQKIQVIEKFIKRR